MAIKPGSSGSKTLGCLVAVLVALLITIVGVGTWLSIKFSPDPPESKRAASVDPALVAKVAAEHAVKSTMNNPASYEYVSHTTRATEFEGMKGYRVDLAFRGTNAFGGVIVDNATVITDASGAVVLSVTDN